MIPSRSKNSAQSGNDSRALIRRMKRARHGAISATHSLLARADPDFAVVYEELFELLMTKDRFLNVKTKELIVIGILASKGAFEALRTHITRAFRVGLTDTEILEALEISMMYGGTESMIHGGQVLAEVTNRAK